MPRALPSVRRDVQGHEDEVGAVGMGCRRDLPEHRPYRGLSPRYDAAQSRGTVQFQPVKGGWMVSYSVRTH